LKISNGFQEYLLLLDTLNPLSSTQPTHLAPFLSSLLISPQISLLATYHTDIQLPSQTSLYTPNPVTILTYLATAILTIRSLPHVIATKRARDRSLQEPVFGLNEHREGIIVGLDKGLGKDSDTAKGVVVEMEIRRRSGRGIIESFVLTPPSSSTSEVFHTTTTSSLSTILLLDDHPLYAPPVIQSPDDKAGDEEPETTFNLGLTEKQKRDREGVVLPYFDAQKEGGAAGPGEGGRILYEMGAEDREDFDDEEDEI